VGLQGSVGTTLQQDMISY